MSKPKAAFIVARAQSGLIAATTRVQAEGLPVRIGLPGGKVEEGEGLRDAAIREAAEEGWAITGVADTPFHQAEVEGFDVSWFAAESAVILSDWLEKGRISPTVVSPAQLADDGFGNDEAMAKFARLRPLQSASSQPDLTVAQIFDDLHTHRRAWAAAVFYVGSSGQECSSPYLAHLARSVENAAALIADGKAAEGIAMARPAFPLIRAGLMVEGADMALEGKLHSAAYFERELKVLDRLERVAKAYFGEQLSLSDWRHENDVSGDEAPIHKPIPFMLQVWPASLRVNFKDGRSLEVEAEGGAISVRNYVAELESPVSVRIGQDDEITIEDRDFRAEQRARLDSPEP